MPVPGRLTEVSPPPSERLGARDARNHRSRSPVGPGQRFTLDSLAALHRHAGNARTGALLRQVTPRANPAWANAAAANTRRRFAENSIRTIQSIIGAMPADGRWTVGWVDALVRWQGTKGYGRADGIIGRLSIDGLVKEGVAQGLQSNVIHLVAGFLDLDVRSRTVSIRHDPRLTTPWDVQFTAGLSRKIRIGDQALTSSSALEGALKTALAAPEPSVSHASAPKGLAVAEAVRAAEFNRTISSLGPLAVRAIQAALGEPPSGRFTFETSQRISDLQDQHGLSGRGRLDEYTVRAIVERLVANGADDDAVRLIVDWNRLDESLVDDVAVDSTRPTAMQTGDRTITLNSLSRHQRYADTVHDIEGAFEQNRALISGRSIFETAFLVARARAMSAIEDVFATSALTIRSEGFVNDAMGALDTFKALDPPEQQGLKRKFLSLRRRVQERFNIATAGDRAAHQALLIDYQAVVL